MLVGKLNVKFAKEDLHYLYDIWEFGDDVVLLNSLSGTPLGRISIGCIKHKHWSQERGVTVHPSRKIAERNG